MINATENYSGIVLNQNVVPTTSSDKVSFLSQPAFYQEFTLPQDYTRGVIGDEQIIPPLSGFHFMVEVAPGTKDKVGFGWELERYIIGTGWDPVEGGTGEALGAPAEGDQVWMKAIAADPIAIPYSFLGDKFRIKILPYAPTSPVTEELVSYNSTTNTVIWDSKSIQNFVLSPGVKIPADFRGQKGYIYQAGIGDPAYFTEVVSPVSIWYSAPNPLALNYVMAYEADGTTPLLSGPGDTVSFLFRVLALVADSGMDFLGNSYRSAVQIYSVDNTSTVNGENTDHIWMSKPNPSRFAVESLYYDIRKKMAQTYAPPNLVKNPNAEAGAAFWEDPQTGDPATVSTVWAAEGSQSIRSTGTTAVGTAYHGLSYNRSTPTKWMRVRGGQKYSFSAEYNIVTLPPSATDHRVRILWADVAGTVLSGQEVDLLLPILPTTVGEKTVASSGIEAPGSAYYATVEISTKTTTSGQTFDYLLDKVLFTERAVVPDYFDGNSPGYFWEDSKNLSISFPLTAPTIDDAATVVDRVLVDPVTPGVFFSIYYSNEGTVPDSEAGWENKLWTRVNGLFQANKRDTHALPGPITAKFIKIEFGNLQAKSYNPGDLARPISYKKHPKWVLEYFMARVNARNDLEERLMHKRVGIVFDGYDLAYNYYLDDLKQEPDQPIELNSSSSEVAGFLQDPEFIDQIDPAMLNQIRVAFQPYASDLSGWFGNSLLGTVAGLTMSTVNNDHQTESDPGAGYVTTIRNPEVAFENDVPVMFFFITCRHKYKEVIAPLSHNRAYFVGIRQISFSRDSYNEAFDTDHYIEPAGDLLNIERNDLITVNGIMTTN